MPTPTPDEMWRQIQGLLGRVNNLETHVGTPTVSLATFEAYFTGLTGWTSYTPTLVQSAAVAHTVNYAKYLQVGKAIMGNVKLTVTGTGTANNAVIVNVPVAAVTPSYNVVGYGRLYDASAATDYTQTLIFNGASTTDCLLYDTTLPDTVFTGQTGAGFAAAIANNDEIHYSFFYEVP